MTEMNAVKSQIDQNEAIAKQFFTTVASTIEKHVESEGAKSRMTETCQHILLLAPLLKILQDYVTINSMNDE